VHHRARSSDRAFLFSIYASACAEFFLFSTLIAFGNRSTYLKHQCACFI